MSDAQQYKLSFYVPASHCEAVKEAVFAAGAGTIGSYRRCAWQVLGQGQFEAMEGSDPFIGAVGELETIEEYKVELLCPAPAIRAAIAALLASHPYETPAYDVMQVINIDELV